MMDELTQFLETLKANTSPGSLANNDGPTPVTAWRQSRTQMLILPSGNVILVKQIGIYDLIEQGGIPQTLSAEAAAVAGPGLAKITEEQLRKYIQVVNLVVCACAVEPKISPKANDGMLGVDELTFVDRQEIFKWACGLGHRLRPFRRESAGDLSAS